MSCFRSVFSAAQALRGTFITALEPQAVEAAKRLPIQQLRYTQQSSAPRASPLPPRPLIRRTAGPEFSPNYSSPDPFAPKPAAPRAQFADAFSATDTPRPSPSKTKPSKGPLIRDEIIPSSTVVIAQEDGSLGEPMPLKLALRQFNRAMNFLVQFEKSEGGRPAVCKIVNKGQYNKLLAEREPPTKAKQKAKTPVKQIELNWAIDPHDLSHRLGQMEDFLDKGKRVSLVLVTKPRKRRASPDEATRLLASIDEKLTEIGAIEVKKRIGKPLGRMEYTLEKEKKAA